MFSWMVWTTPVAVFFSCIVVMLALMTLWETRAPSVLRRFSCPSRPRAATVSSSG